MKYLASLIFLFCIASCSTKVFKYKKSDYFIVGNEKFIHARYIFSKELYNESDYQLTIKNDHNEDIYLFSTVLENKDMFYSDKNYKKNKNTLKLNSFYDGYMKDASHSGIRKFNFIPLKQGDSLIINLDYSILVNVEKIELTYYYYLLNAQQKSVINIENNILQKGTVTKYIK